jgi:hypothetical protein
LPSAAQRSRFADQGYTSASIVHDPADIARCWLACCELEAHTWMRGDESDMQFDEDQPGFDVLRRALEQAKRGSSGAELDVPGLDVNGNQASFYRAATSRTNRLHTRTHERSQANLR